MCPARVFCWKFQHTAPDKRIPPSDYSPNTAPVGAWRRYGNQIANRYHNSKLTSCAISFSANLFTFKGL